MRPFYAAAAVLLAGCSSSDDAPFTCAIGQLTGTWHVSYVKQDGSCGDLNSETVVLSAALSSEASRCTIAAQTVAPDRCSMEEDFTCPLLGGGAGSQHWVGILRQRAANRMEGPHTLYFTSPELACRATYLVIWERQ